MQKLLVGREPFLLSQFKNNLLGLRKVLVALYNILTTSRRPMTEGVPSARSLCPCPASKSSRPVRLTLGLNWRLIFSVNTVDDS